MTAPFPASEEARLATLGSLNVLDTLPEWEFDGLVEIAQALMGTSMAYLSFIDRDRQWIKAGRGVDVCEAPRKAAYCAHTILESEPVVAPDTRLDARFADSPFTTNGAVRFYVGIPVRVEGEAVGTFCVADGEPREADARAISALAALARQVEALLTSRLRARRLAESERRFVAFLDHAPAIAFLKDETGRMRFVNRGFDQVYAGDSVLGCLDGEWLPKPVAEEVGANDTRVRESGQTFVIEERVPLVDGTPKTWLSYKFPIWTEGETWVGGVAIDVTAQREIEETVRRQSEELSKALEGAQSATEAARLSALRFEQLFDGLPVACYTHDAEGTIFEWNVAAETLWQLPSVYAFGQSVYDLVGEANREAKRATVARAFAGESIEAEESCIALESGEVRWLLTNTFPRRNPLGTIVGVVSANIDITERKRLEGELRTGKTRPTTDGRRTRTRIGATHGS